MIKNFSNAMKPNYVYHPFFCLLFMTAGGYNCVKEKFGIKHTVYRRQKKCDDHLHVLTCFVEFPAVAVEQDQVAQPMGGQIRVQ